MSPAGPPALAIEFPPALPVSARREEIASAIASHPVVVICGETGSGKTTQLPKIALSIGRGLAAGGRGLIGHTQPRRIAATSVARRIAQELNTPLGEVVGYKVRFQDRLQRGASVKLMTDGILLAETQSDPLLRAYDTIIVDEAHERSLNIDFLLGHLKQILPRRPDLKVIVTSATIDADRFANHFAVDGKPAPVIMVSGRTFPVELRWRPMEEPRKERRDDRSAANALNDALADAVDELWQGAGRGDVLIFLPGEREIREGADHLRRHLSVSTQRRGGPPVEVVPLFARLSQQEQDRVFEPSSGPRVVLATNVAETSLTVPGIRYVVDAGTARVKRYSYRSKVEQLQVEAISQAAAQQRSGRCGRVADGICIRLYDEVDFTARPKFTDPEILRSSLAGVILRMKSLRLGAVEEFPFIEPPSRKAIADGYELLMELGAVDEARELTDLGASLARLPLDPRVGRMILASVEHQCLSEMLVIASALSVQDVRDRPLDQQQAADERHRPFDDERSEFVGYLKLWQWIDEARGVHGHAQAKGETTPHVVDKHKLSNRQQEQRLRDHFVSPRRVREWRDIHAQLLSVAGEHAWRMNSTPATFEQIHVALLSGLLGNIGCKADDDEWYLGARGIKFWRHPGAHLSKKPGRWIVASELVETTRLFARGLAVIDPAWLPRVASHVIKTQLLDPHWEKKAADVIALERASLYGVVVYANRRVSYGRVDPVEARRIFIREALVAGEWDSDLPFLAHNRRLVREVQALEHKARRQDVLVDESLIEAFYDAQVGPDVCSGASMERWYRQAHRAQPRLLYLDREELMRHQAAGVTTATYPSTIRLGGIDCAATYLHEPGDAKDGVTVTVPIYALNQVSEERCEWLVPGMLEAKVLTLLKSLPQKPRARLVPLPTTASEAARDLPFAQGSLVDALLAFVRERAQLPVQRQDFKLDQMPAHLSMNLRVVDEHGRQLAMGRHLPALRAQWGSQARGAFQALAVLKVADGVRTTHETPVAAPGVKHAGSPTRMAEHGATPGPNAHDASQRHLTWDFGSLPELLEVRRGGQSMVGFPAIVDGGDHVRIEVFDEPDVALHRHRLGLRRLFALTLKEPLRYVEKQLPDLQRLSMAYMVLGTADELKAQIIDVALDRVFLFDPLPTDAAQFQSRVEDGRTKLGLVTQDVTRHVGSVLAEHGTALRKLKDARAPREVADDIQQQLAALVPKRFITDTPWSQMQHLPRYLKAICLRLDKQRSDAARDAQRLAELRPQVQRYQRRLAEQRGVVDVRLQEYRWLLEELRVSFFAQELRTPTPVSVKRLDKLWAQLSA